MTAALEQLTELLAPPSASPNTDWDRVERALGAVLPTDYKELIDTYGGGYWDDYLYVLEPGCPNDNYDLLTWADQQTEALEGLWEFEKKPTILEPAGTSVLPWATTDNGECLYWLIRPGHHPDDWTVMINEARGDRWEQFPHTCTQFLASALTGVVRSTLLSDHYFPLHDHKFERLRAV